MKKRAWIVLASVTLLLMVVMICTSAVSARAESGVEYEFAFAVHSLSDDQYIRHVGPDASKDVLGNNEYYAIYMTIHNNSGQPLSFSKVTMMIDSEEFSFGALNLQDGKAISLFLGHDSTKKILPGKHTCTVKADDIQVYSTRFKMPRDWGSVMTLPTADQLKKAGSGRSPYIGWYTYFSENGGFTEYAIDLRMDFQPIGTYICPINWWMNLSSLRERYTRVWSDYGSDGGGYCGFQVGDDGSGWLIMTLWDVFCEDAAGNVKQVKAKVLYPENATDTDYDNSGEGSFVHYVYKFNWKPGRDYRVLLKQFTGSNGNVLLTLWLKDLDAGGDWKELYCFDTGLQDIWINSAAGFVENFKTRVAAYPRAIEFWNIRGRMKNTGKWENAQSIYYSINAGASPMAYEGSYNFGQDAANCWIITSGTTGLCTSNQNTGPYKVPATESGAPNGSDKLEPKIQIQTGWYQNVDDRWHFRRADGTDAVGWLSQGTGWFYLENTGEMVTGWKWIDGKWYHFTESGVMDTGWKQIGGQWYYFEESGAMRTGWLQVGSVWYYLGDDGAMQTGWLKAGTVWYYLGSDGVMVTGTAVIGGVANLFDASGIWLGYQSTRTGWAQENGVWAYYNESGSRATGWKKISGVWYWFDGHGAMQTGWQKIGGNWYFFMDSGAMVTGWYEDKDENNHSTWYWFDENGQMAIGWKEINGQWEMFADSGAWLYTWDGN